MKRLAAIILSLALLILPSGGRAATRVSDNVAVIVSAASSNTTATVPAGYVIRDVFMHNLTANAVTGGIKIGTTSGAVDVVVALAVVASAYALTVPLIRQWQVDQTLFIQAVGAWNSASVDIVITLDRAVP